MDWSRIETSLSVLPVADSLAVLVGTFCLAVLARQYQRKQASSLFLPLPPCPSKQGAPDHAAIMPKAFEYYAYEKWAKELNSDIIHVQVGKKFFVVLSSWKAISEIFEQTAPLYSDRPGAQDFFKNIIVGWGWTLGALSYGERWRKGRAVFQKHFHPSNKKVFQPRQLAFIRLRLLRQLLEEPSNTVQLVKAFSGGLSLAITYGIDIQAESDPYVELIEKAMNNLKELSPPGLFLVDRFRILRFVPSWFPGAGWKRRGLVWRKLQEDTRSKVFERSMECIADGTIKSSFVEEAVSALNDPATSSEQLEIIKDVAATVFGAATDTTASTINTAILAMLCHPDCQEKAQKELDRVLGLNRLPTFEDQKNLPYITAVVKESMRWSNATPTGLPHVAVAEGEYKSYRIPKGAVVLGNVWALMHDEHEYPEPMKFNPDRFLNPDGSLNTVVRDPETAVFGFGRRVCPGRHIALSAVWMTIASILAAFKIEKGTDDDGKAIEPVPKFLPGFVMSPAPFPVTLRVRSKEMETMLQNAEELHL